MTRGRSPLSLTLATLTLVGQVPQQSLQGDSAHAHVHLAFSETPTRVVVQNVSLTLIALGRWPVRTTNVWTHVLEHVASMPSVGSSTTFLPAPVLQDTTGMHLKNALKHVSMFS